MTARTIRIGLMADPGVPALVTGAVAPELSRELSDALSETGTAVRWEVEVGRTTLPINPEGEITLMQQAPRIRAEHGWKYVVYLTDLPRSHQAEPMLCEASSAAQAALVSVPALGAYRLQARTRELLVALIQSLHQGTEDFPPLLPPGAPWGITECTALPRQDTVTPPTSSFPVE